MREAELWTRLNQALGEAYARVWTQQMALRELGGRTVQEALEAGMDYKTIWRACWVELELPARDR